MTRPDLPNSRLNALVSLLQSPTLRDALGDGYIEQDESKLKLMGGVALARALPVGLAEESTEGTFDDASTCRLQPSFSQSPTQGMVSTPPHPPGSLWDVTPEETQGHVAMFRDKMLRFFAFMYLPPEHSAHQLQQEQCCHIPKPGSQDDGLWPG